jgi:hypothetical protein
MRLRAIIVCGFCTRAAGGMPRLFNDGHLEDGCCAGRAELRRGAVRSGVVRSGAVRCGAARRGAERRGAERILQNTTFEARRRDRVVLRMPHTRTTTRPAGIASNVRLCRFLLGSNRHRAPTPSPDARR